MVALYTGLRHEDVRTLRFEFVDWDERTLHLPDPKGGEAKAFTIPLSSTPFAILERRRKDNPTDLGDSDDGWCFPALDQEGIVAAITDLRQATTVRDKEGNRRTDGRFPIEDVHTLRRTWESIANDEGITELDQHVLSNHSFGSHNVNATYISQHIDHLAACAEKIDAGITRRINGTPVKRRGRLRAVA
jgi:integrase